MSDGVSVPPNAPLGPYVVHVQLLTAIRLAREGVEVIEERLSVPMNGDFPLIRLT